MAGCRLPKIDYLCQKWLTVLFRFWIQTGFAPVEVEAEGLYEAAVLGLAAFKKHDIELNPNGLHTLDVEVRSSITHSVPIRKVYQWLQQGVRPLKRLC